VLFQMRKLGWLYLAIIVDFPGLSQVHPFRLISTKNLYY
jgi:hypothetical protein